MTPKMASSTSQAAPVCEPKKRDRRFSRFGEWITRMVMNVAIEIRTATAKKSSMKPMTAVLPMSGMGEAAGEQVPEGLDDGEDQDGEAPHGEEVGHARHRPLQQLLLPGDLDQLGLDPGRDVLDPARDGGLTGSDEPAQPEEPSTRDGEHHER